VKADGSPYGVDEVVAILPPVSSPSPQAKGHRRRGPLSRTPCCVSHPMPSNGLRDLYAIHGPFTRDPLRRRQHGRPRGQRQGLSRCGFLPVLRELRPQVSGHQSIHPTPAKWTSRITTSAIRCCSARQRIGHGVNLITDPDTMVMMRKRPLHG